MIKDHFSIKFESVIQNEIYEIRNGKSHKLRKTP